MPTHTPGLVQSQITQSHSPHKHGNALSFLCPGLFSAVARCCTGFSAGQRSPSGHSSSGEHPKERRVAEDPLLLAAVAGLSQSGHPMRSRPVRQRGGLGTEE